MEIKCYLLMLLLIFILVPVIAVFTKMDVLIDEARNQLIGEELPFEELQVQVPFRARAIFEKNYLRRLDNVEHPPRDVVQLYGMLRFVNNTV